MIHIPRMEYSYLVSLHITEDIASLIVAVHASDGVLAVPLIDLIADCLTCPGNCVVQRPDPDPQPRSPLDPQEWRTLQEVVINAVSRRSVSTAGPRHTNTPCS